MTTEFFWTQMNYNSLVEVLRALMSKKGICQGCGHAFVNERDIQIDHRDPPRHQHDWGRLHARNLCFLCASCNNTKGAKPSLTWLDEQEGARLSNLDYRDEPAAVFDDEPQLLLDFT